MTSLWNVTSITLTSLKHYPKWCGAVIVACFYALCVYLREKTHSRCLALVIVFEEDGLVFSDALHLPPPIPVCCWNRKWVLGSVQLLCCASGSYTTHCGCVFICDRDKNAPPCVFLSQATCLLTSVAFLPKIIHIFHTLKGVVYPKMMLLLFNLLLFHVCVIQKNEILKNVLVYNLSLHNVSINVCLCNQDN